MDATKKFRSNIYSFHFIRILLGLQNTTCVFHLQRFFFSFFFGKGKINFLIKQFFFFSFRNSLSYFRSLSLSLYVSFADKSISTEFQYKQNQWFRNIEQDVSMNVVKLKQEGKKGVKNSSTSVFCCFLLIHDIIIIDGNKCVMQRLAEKSISVRRNLIPSDELLSCFRVFVMGAGMDLIRKQSELEGWVEFCCVFFLI